MMGDTVYDFIENKPELDLWSSASVNLQDLRNKFHDIGVQVSITPEQFADILFKSNETRDGILLEVIKKIHPEEPYWNSKSEEETQSKILQVCKWFGLTTEISIVCGNGTSEEQLNFWTNSVSIASDLSNATSETIRDSDLDLNLAKIVGDLVLSDSILEETIKEARNPECSNKSKEKTAEKAEMNYIIDEMVEFGELEVNELENGLQDLKLEALFGKFPTRRFANTSKKCFGRCSSLVKYYGRDRLPLMWNPAKMELQSMFAQQGSRKLQDIQKKMEKIKDAVGRVNQRSSSV